MVEATEEEKCGPYTQKSHPALNREETLTHVTISLEEDILLCENMLLKPDKYYVIPLR